ncbi:hypothetical protein IV203_019937 [Nitzschia inconspicua]|uniref:Uncharacterized protein n=1 Tax=Nitzschia inconspicua TaxID=303405 RepID=A0A9K3Q4S4_9STRA|nr:hypothetical protein IV203_019937 [Nitzschia inconspicua]
MNLPSHHAISRNNVAVAQIKAGQYRSSISGLTAAIHSFKHLITSTETGITNGPNTIVIDDFINEISLFTDTDDAESQYLYDDPIRIPEVPCADGCSNNAIGSTYLECSMISSVVVFNLALAHHLEADRLQKLHHEEGQSDKSTSDEEPTSDEEIYAGFRKAQQLYEIVLNMHRDVQGKKCACDRGANVVFALAIVNNLGLIHRELHNNDASRKCFQHILSTLMCLTDAGYGDRLSSKLHPFFVNVTPLISKTRVASAG